MRLGKSDLLAIASVIALGPAWAHGATMKQFTNSQTGSDKTAIGFDPPIPQADASYTGFRTYSALLGAMGNLLHQGLVFPVNPLGITGKRSKLILAYKVSAPTDSWGNSSTRKNDLAATKPQIVFVGGAHAREWIGPEAVVRFAASLVNEYKNAAPNSKARYLLDNAEVYVIPDLNVDGRLFSEEHPIHYWELTSTDLQAVGLNPAFEDPDRHGRLRRKNLVPGNPDSWPGSYSSNILEGTDINRNMDSPARSTYTYSESGCASVSTTTYSIVYNGPSAASSVEASKFGAFVQASSLPQLRAVVDVHSYGAKLIYENVNGLSGINPTFAARRDSRTSSLVSAVASNLNSNPSPTSYTTQQCSPIASIDDYSGAIRLVPSFTLELYPSTTNAYNYGSTYGFVIPDSVVPSVTSQSSIGLRSAASWIARDPWMKKTKVYQPGGGAGGSDKILYQDEIVSNFGGRTLQGGSVDPTNGGSLEVRLEFSGPMSTGTPSVRLVSGSSSATFSGGSWSATTYENDTWTGSTSISSATWPSGTATLEVDATDEFGGKLDGKPLTVRGWADGDWSNYEDENGAGRDGGKDTRASFMVKTTGAAGGDKDRDGNPPPAVVASTYCIAPGGIDTSGLASITLSGPGGSSTTTVLDCSPQARSTDTVGPLFCDLALGTYTVTRVNCAGVPSVSTYTVYQGTNTGFACFNGDCRPFSFTPGGYQFLKVEGLSGCSSPCDRDFFCEKLATISPVGTCHDNDGLPFYMQFTGGCQGGFSFSVTNSTTTSWPGASRTTAGLTTGAATWDFGAPGPGGTLNGTVSLAQDLSACTNSNADDTVEVRSAYRGVTITLLRALTQFLLDFAVRQVLRPVADSWATASGSDIVFNSSTTIRFGVTPPAGADISTSTLAIYRFDGVSWSSAEVAEQYIYRASSTSVIIATGTITRSGDFALFFQGVDTLAPISTFSIAGSSSVFDGTLFVSTAAFAVLVATDPPVDGYSSRVSTIYYRMDAMSPAEDFSVYSSSIPLPLGLHVLEYRAQDYAGNFEAVRISTFLVTAGTRFRASENLVVPGKALAGFLDTGAQFKAESRAENAYTLFVSSPDASVLLSVSNIGQVGVGRVGEGTLDIASSTAAGALGLRSGNVAGYSSRQVAFGYNGTEGMAHALRTEHSTTTAGNRLDFLVWEGGAGSTSTAARLELVSLQAIGTSSAAVHVRPVGIADANLEVSDGVTTGGGTIRRGRALMPSSRELKSDIKYLGEKDEEQAARDVLALKHSSFKFKRRLSDGGLVEDPSAPVQEGLIYEEAPESIRAPGGAISLDQRIVNLELALKAKLRELARLEERLKAVRER